MAGPWDAEIKLLYPADAGTFFTVDTIDSKTAFVAVANVEIGENLNENVSKHDVWVVVRNLSKSTIVATTLFTEPLIPENNKARRQEVRVDIDDAWTAEEGDILELVASYKVTAGVNKVYSSTDSKTFIVSA